MKMFNKLKMHKQCNCHLFVMRKEKGLHMVQLKILINLDSKKTWTKKVGISSLPPQTLNWSINIVCGSNITKRENIFKATKWLQRGENILPHLKRTPYLAFNQFMAYGALENKWNLVNTTIAWVKLLPP